MEKMLDLKIRVPASAIVDALIARASGSPVFVACDVASDDVPRVGELWPSQGGIRAAECRAEDGRIYDLVVVTGTDDKPVIFENEEWGSRGIEVEDADSKRDGFANTQALVKAGNELAKRITTETTVHGHTDCYWPAICEVQQVHANLGYLFSDSDVWSSTQYSANGAWYQNFGSGRAYYWGKDNRFRAFVVRRVYR